MAGSHMFFAEFASGYARDMGEIQKHASALNLAKEMARQMISLIDADLKYPKEFYAPLPRYTAEKYTDK